MWFAKFFGGRQDDDSEPSEHPPHPVVNAPKAAQTTTGRPRSAAKDVTKKKKGPNKGFDPYNSGTFDKHQAWRRVIR